MLVLDLALDPSVTESVSSTTETIFRVIDLAAVLANGLLGGVIARSMRFDFIGFVLLAVFSGMGGGMIRDVLLDQGMPVMLTDSGYLVCGLSAAAIAYVIDLSGVWANRVLGIIDYLGMGCWAATGVTKALYFGVAPLQAIALGVCTAVGGGMIRDVIINRIPAIFGNNPLYATVAFLGATLAAISILFFDQPVIGMGLSIIFCTVLGVTARLRRWTLPGPTNINVRVPRPQFKRSSRRRSFGWIPGQPLPADPERHRRSRQHNEDKDNGDGTSKAT